MPGIIRGSRNKDKVLVVAELKLLFMYLRGGCLCIYCNYEARTFYKPVILVCLFLSFYHPNLLMLR